MNFEHKYVIYRGTTPTLKYKMPIEAQYIRKIFFTFKQFDNTVFEKEINDFTRDDIYIYTTLSQQDTLKLKANNWVNIQLKIKINNKVLATSPYQIYVKDSYHQEEI